DSTAAILRESIRETAATLDGNNRVLAFGCTGSAELERTSAAGNAVVQTRCMGQLSPTFVDYVLSRGFADGVLLLGCDDGACKYRYGTRWTEQRIARERDPRLRKRIDNQRVACAWQQPWMNRGDVVKISAEFQASLEERGDR
ncbi:MAG: hydrogenase iron-sulfur subunit, partial [Woeseia sp.]